MELSDNFKPRLSDPSLLFTSEDFVVIEDLKRGLRRLLSRWHHPSAALMMVETLNFQYLRSRNRSSRVILAMADSQMAECVIVDIYARVLQCKSRVTTARAKYYVVLEGFADLEKVNFLTQHYFWLSSAFTDPEDQRGQRHLMN